MNHVCIWSDCAGFSWRPKAPGKPLQRNRLENSELPSGDAAASFFFWRLDSSILMLLLSDTLVLRVFVWPEHGRASCAMWALYPLSDRGSIFRPCYRKGHCFMSWLWRSDGYWRTGSSSSMTSGRPSHQSFKRGLQLQRFHAAMAMTVRLWISSSKNWTSHDFDFDRPVYCRQTVFRLKFRLFCRLYTVGRL